MTITSRVTIKHFFVITVLLIFLYWLLLPGPKKEEEKEIYRSKEISRETSRYEESEIEIENLEKEKNKVSLFVHCFPRSPSLSTIRIYWKKRKPNIWETILEKNSTAQMQYKICNISSYSLPRVGFTLNCV